MFFHTHCKNISFIWQVYLFIYLFDRTKEKVRAGSSDLRQILQKIFHTFWCETKCILVQFVAYLFCCTSSNFCAIMEKALKMPSVGPVMVTILSGDDPSDMLIRAPLWKHKSTIILASICCSWSAPAHKLHAFMLTSSLIFLTVSPFWNRDGNRKREVWLVS